MSSVRRCKGDFRAGVNYMRCNEFLFSFCWNRPILYTSSAIDSYSPLIAPSPITLPL